MKGKESSIMAVVRAEHLKMRHTFGRSLPAAAPLLALFLVLSFASREAFVMCAWNWWYTMLMPGMLSVLCYLTMKREKKLHYCNLLTVPVSPAACMFGKIMYCALELCLANLLLALGTFAAAVYWGTNILVQGGLAAVVVLSVCSLWEIPFFMMISARFGVFASIFSCMVLTVGGTAVLAGSGLWWLCPSAIPIRMMCPVLGILPNGLPVPADSSLSDPGVLFPGIVLCLAWFAGLTRAASYSFQEFEMRNRRSGEGAKRRIR